jgi:microfibrillar-associated protein 1|eukprot:COSAG06_NODE_1214_length_10237_cov_116.386664_2_plen_454_part_00
MSSTLGAAVGSSKTGKDGRMEKVRVSRHWAGQRPKWADEEEEEEGMADVIARRQQARTGGDAPADADDPRLRRMAESSGGTSDRAAAMARRRAMMEAEVVEGSGSEDESDGGSDEEPARSRHRDVGRRERPAAAAVVEADDDEEDDDEIEDRRARARAKALAREEEVVAAEEEDDESQSESESEYETETESEEENTFGVRAIAKPVFVRKSERESILEREKQEAEEEAREEEKVARKEDRKVETRQKITSEILKEQEGGGDEATDWEDMPDDDDEADEAALYEAWRIRELRRVKREFDERAAAAHAKAEIERRRKMTDEEIAKEDADAFKNTKKGMKEEKWGFMQKYYHRGAFFQDVKEDGSGMAEPLYQRDIGGKTGWEDQFDRAALPKVKQKRNFGMAGQVKWTHLKDNDTSQGDGGSLRQESRYAIQKTKERLVSNSSLDRPARKKPKAA